ncbi:GumC family protein [Actomonas aquatica]|uniref:non-specific protein-tyrosine kinase n=1 Tax=Actomonas aquatica TaxID=2866162 RepID=A0ABZ1C6M2_9BACT|nr:polysaccharide biosynthesis tyrosine autokinase [Opitutus sp. WL0086]WRQ87171.1 polysaccharide biosynthesis tyrosine autokinase [Opitutus sp. WL0086]
MNLSDKENSPQGGDYGYGGYAGYGSGGYGEGEGTAHRSFQDYLLILRERIWYIIVVFLVVFSSVLVYTTSATRIYEATATVQLLRDDPKVMQVEAVVDTEIRGAEDLNTQVKLLESMNLIESVANRLTGDELTKFLAPYVDEDSEEPLLPHGILAENRKIVPQRLSLVIAIQYRHPDRVIAARVANYFTEEFINFNNRQRIEETLKAVDDLKLRADEQGRKVDELANELQSYREKNNMVSLDERRDIVTDRLKALGMNVTELSTELKQVEVRYDQLEERKDNLNELAELPFVASDPHIAALKQQIAAENIAIAELQERYRAKHPRMIEARRKLEQTNAELESAIRGMVRQIESQYDAAKRSLAEARKDLVEQETESLALSRAAVDYDKKEREYLINKELHNSIVSRMRETNLNAAMDNQNARVIDRAQPSKEGNFVSPNIVLNLGLGLIGGAGLGLGFAFFVAFIDDRVKSSFDIESVVGVPLVGIIPQIKKLDPVEKAQVVINNSDRQVAEAFLTLHSALRLKEEAKNAKCLLTTSTIPGEGKSFTTTNLALTFAAHGEKVCVVDCDLRKPNIHKTLQLENVKGVIDIVGGTADLDDVAVKDVFPGLDVITTGGRAKNPTHVLNSRNFEKMIEDLRKRYDRVFIDTPPLAAVSDAMIILPLVDGSLFTIFFNKVRRKAAQFAAKKLLESNVPLLGAVLNGLNLAVSGYYYAQYYDKSYKDYYVVMSKNDDTPERS